VKLSLLILFAALAPAILPAQETVPHRLTPVPIQQVVIEDEFWSPKFQVWRDVTIPDCLGKFEKDGALANFDKVRDGKGGDHGGPPWYDGLIYEMIRASADFLAAHPDPKLEARLDGYIQRIAAAAAKDPDGYLNSYTQLKEPDHRWGRNGGDDRRQHDLYNAGALVDAGVHYYRATGKIELLRVATKLANRMADVMGPPPKQNIIPGHALGEEALVNLYRLFKEQPQLKSRLSLPVDEQRYLELAEFWIDARGHHEGRIDFGAYDQDEIPVSQQETIEGHAVRAMLLCSGLVAAGEASDRSDYLTKAQRLWNSMTSRRMYVTGGVGAESNDEKFGPDYYLPNKTAYAETCAAVAAGFFDQNLNLAFADAKYADALERELFNGALVGVSLKGNSYFYDNPLEAGPQHQRWPWHSCPCCPPMFLKLMGGLPGYVYAQAAGAIYVNQFIGSRATIDLPGSKVNFRLTTRYPWDGNIRLAIDPEKAAEFDLFIRIPAWCQEASSTNDLYQIADQPDTGAAKIMVNGKAIEKLEIVRGYARLHRQWQAGDVVELSMDMPVRQVRANAQVEADRDQVALMRGPVVYCAESVDNPVGIQHLVVPPEATFRAEHKPDLLGGVVVLQGKVRTVDANKEIIGLVPAELVAVPYYASANRESSTMRVWLPARPDKAAPITLANRSRASASYCWHLDSVEAIHDGIVPTKSSDTNLPRLSWWNHKGTTEWAELDFPQATTVSKVRVFWFADKPVNGGCDVPQSWSILYRDGDNWKPVEHPGDYSVVLDQFNEVTFTRVKTSALRLRVQLKPDWSGGIYEWEVEGPTRIDRNQGGDAPGRL
jgi:DUF1680 family protein